MIDQPFCENVGAALPINIAAPSRQEASYGVPTQMMDPTFLAKLPHQGINPGEPGLAKLPTLKPRFCPRRVDGVFPRGQTCVGGDFAGEVPWNETTVGIVNRLGERVPYGRLSAKVHFPKQELPDEIRWNGRRLRFLIPINDGSSTVVEQAAREGAKMEVRGEKSRRLRGEGCRRRVRFREGSSVCFISNNFVKLREGNSLPASVSGRRGLETQLGKFRDREITSWAGKLGVRSFLTRTENDINVWLLGRYSLVKVKRSVPRVGKILRCRNRLWNGREFLAGLMGLIPGLLKPQHLLHSELD